GRESGQGEPPQIWRAGAHPKAAMLPAYAVKRSAMHCTVPSCVPSSGGDPFGRAARAPSRTATFFGACRHLPWTGSIAVAATVRTGRAVRDSLRPADGFLGT